MKLFNGHQEIDSKFANVVLTIGNFDGLHAGHKSIIEAIIREAKKIGGVSMVFTFRPHPQTILNPAIGNSLIYSYEEKIKKIEKMGVDVVIEEPFNREFSSQSAKVFFDEAIVKKIKPVSIYVGYDFGFGKDRSGSLEILKTLTQEKKIELKIFDPLQVDGLVCSSSKIREYISAGDVKSASKLLGEYFSYRGVIVKGNGRGRKIGFATANVQANQKLMVKEGVYATFALYKDQRFLSVTNVGRQPTFNLSTAAPVAIETHIFDFDQDIYGEVLEVQFVSRLRAEKKFESVQELITQIGEDSNIARKILESLGP